jgi:predicted DsbA family dithiol-disulfide isomerase
MIDNMTRTGTEEGIAFDFEKAIPANTFDAHRLLHWARRLDGGSGSEHAQVRLKEAFMVAHFEQGVDLGSHSGLLGVVDSLGLDVDDAASVLSSDTHTGEVRGDEEEAQMLGITGVPFFVIGRFGVSGAQRPATLVDAIQRALSEQEEAEREEQEPTTALEATETEMCTPESC